MGRKHVLNLYKVCLRSWLSNQVLKHEPRLTVNFQSSSHWSQQDSTMKSDQDYLRTNTANYFYLWKNLCETHIFRFLVYIMFSYMLKCINFVMRKQIALMKARTQVCHSTHKIFIEYALQRHGYPLGLQRKAKRKRGCKCFCSIRCKFWQSHTHKAAAFPHT